MIDVSQEWDLLSQLPGESWYAARLYYGDGNSYLSIGSKDFELDDEKFLGIITNRPKITGGFDFETRETQINSGVIEVVNKINELTTFGSLVSTLSSGGEIGTTNRRVDLRIIKEGITKFDNGYPLLRRGRMYRPAYGTDKVVIKIEDNTKNRLGNLGVYVTDDDATAGYTLPPQSAGKIRPIIYCDHRYYINAELVNGITKEQWDPVSLPRLVPAVDLGGGAWLVEGDKVAGTPSKSEGDALWAKNPGGGGYMMSTTLSLLQNSSGGCIVTGGGDFEVIDRPILVEDVGANAWTDPEDSIDGDVTTGATISLNGVNQTGILRFTFPEARYPQIYEETQMFLTGEGNWGLSNQLFINGDLSLYFIGENSAVPVDPLISFVSHAIVGGAIPEADVNDPIDLTFRAYSIGVKVANIIDVYRRIFVVDSDYQQLYWGGLGHAIGDYMDEADRSGHFDYGNAGELANNPATCIESVGRSDMGLVDDDINMPSFDVSSQRLASYLASFDIRERSNYKSFMVDMAREFRSIVGFDTNSQLFMGVILDRYESADVVVNYKDISGLVFDLSDDDALTSKVGARYSYDYETYLHQVDDVENTTTREYYDLSEAATSKSLELQKVNDKPTAELVRDFDLAFWQESHNTIKRMGLGQGFMKYGPGDLMMFEDLPDDVLPNGEDITKEFVRAGQNILPFFMINWFEKSIDGVVFKGMQMHDTTVTP